jgi:hypothetical protein
MLVVGSCNGGVLLLLTLKNKFRQYLAEGKAHNPETDAG